MSLYISDTNKPRQGGYDESIGLDIDEAVVRDAPGTDQSYYDYDLLIKGVSGSGVVIPSDLDDGFPKLSDYNFRDTSSKMYQKAEQREDGMAQAFQLKAFVSDDQKSTLDTMLEGANNGLVSDVDVMRDNPLPPETSLVIIKDNKDTSIKGILEDNSINDIFFSDMNTKVIQDTIRYRVNVETGEVIAKQSDNELYIIMRSIMLQFANFRTGIDNIVDEVRRLNDKVVEYSVENVSSNVKQHKGYVDKLSKLPVPLDMPVYHNKANYTYDISNLL
ncbi:MAG: hypothetical protein CMK44_01235 [Porticoccus sp.]|nr:hypothetical protein [Porticoccus sp.]